MIKGTDLKAQTALHANYALLNIPSAQTTATHEYTQHTENNAASKLYFTGCTSLTLPS